MSAMDRRDFIGVFITFLQGGLDALKREAGAPVATELPPAAKPRATVAVNDIDRAAARRALRNVGEK